MNARVVGQLRVERGDEQTTVAREHGVPVDLGEDLDIGAGVLDPRRADEHRAHGRVVVGEIEVGLEAAHLAAERVAADAEVAEAEMVAVEHDHPRARAEDRRLEAEQRLVDAVEPHQPPDRGRLAARDDQPVEPVELLGKPDLDRFRAEPPQHRRVLAEVPLQREDADPKRLLHGAKCSPG